LLHQGSIQDPRLVKLLRAQLACAFATGVDARALRDEELSAALALSHAKYGNDAWLRRR
jgi:hypothetical protein